jgi:hypothetical protein
MEKYHFLQPLQISWPKLTVTLAFSSLRKEIICETQYKVLPMWGCATSDIFRMTEVYRQG